VRDDLQVGELTATCAIKDVFRLRKLGFVLVLHQGFTGSIFRDGIVKGERGISLFKGPEFVLRRGEDGTSIEYVSVIATDPAAAQWFSSGDTVTIYRRGTMSR